MTDPQETEQMFTDYQPIPSSHPDRVAFLCSCLGFSPAWPPDSTVFELACGDGTNLIPMAFHMPRAKFIGVDSSKELISSAKASALRLGLENVEFIAGDILALSTFQERFDYIITPNIFSFLSEVAQTKICSLSREALNENGVLFINYNTDVRWPFRTHLWSTLLEYIGAHDTIESTLRTVRAVIELLDIDEIDVTDPYTVLIKSELRLARSLSDENLALMLFSPHANSITSSRVADLARDNGLRVIDFTREPAVTLRAELSLHRALIEHGGGQARAEDLIDLVMGHQTRSVLLCRREAEERPTRALPALLERGFFSSPIIRKQTDVNLAVGVDVDFKTRNQHMIRAKEPLHKALLVALMNAWPQGRRFADLIDDALAMVTDVDPADDDANSALIDRQVKDLLSLCRLGGATWRSREPAILGTTPPLVKVFEINRWQATRGHVLTDADHRLVIVDEFTRQLISLLDGTSDQDSLVAAMLTKFETGDLEVKADGKAEKEPLEALVSRLVGESIESLTTAGLLEA